MWGISWLAAKQLAGQEGLCCMEWGSEGVSEWVSEYVSNEIKWRWNEFGGGGGVSTFFALDWSYPGLKENGKSLDSTDLTFFQKKLGFSNWRIEVQKARIRREFVVCLPLQFVAGGDLVVWGTALKVGRWWVSIPDSVIRIFHWHNPSSRTMDLGLTQHLTEMSTRNISWG